MYAGLIDHTVVTKPLVVKLQVLPDDTEFDPAFKLIILQLVSHMVFLKKLCVTVLLRPVT